MRASVPGAVRSVFFRGDGDIGTFAVRRRLSASLERRLPERRVYVRSGEDTRFVRLRPATQLMIWTGGSAALAWTIVATAVILMDGVGSEGMREQARREQAVYEARLEALSTERDAAAAEALAAQERFSSVLARVSAMQADLLEAEGRLVEAGTGLEVVQATLRGAIRERDEARRQLASLEGEAEAALAAARLREADGTVDVLSGALRAAADERDAMMGEAHEALAQLDEMALDARLTAQRNDRIFAQLEEAVSVSAEPLERMFVAAGLSPEQLIDEVRRGYSGQGGPLEPIAVPDGPGREEAARANAIIGALGEVDLYRLAAERVPFADPVPSGAYRQTSGFGSRRDPFTRARRMHSGLDFAGASGTRIAATADGVVTKAGWSRGYGRLVEVEHAGGFTTRYAHLRSIDVERGQRVSRGDRLGGMGSSGRSTGTHLHYEIRMNGTAIDPMTYIKAARDVF